MAVEPTRHEPFGMRQRDREVPDLRLSVAVRGGPRGERQPAPLAEERAEDAVDEPSGARLTGEASQFDRFVQRGVRGNAIEIVELVRGEPQDGADDRRQRLDLAPAGPRDARVERRTPAQGPG